MTILSILKDIQKSHKVNPCLKNDTIIDSSRFNLWRRISNFKRMPKWLEFIKYLVGVPTNVDSEVLAIIKDNENVSEFLRLINLELLKIRPQFEIF